MENELGMSYPNLLIDLHILTHALLNSTPYTVLVSVYNYWIFFKPQIFITLFLWNVSLSFYVSGDSRHGCHLAWDSQNICHKSPWKNWCWCVAAAMEGVNTISESLSFWFRFKHHCLLLACHGWLSLSSSCLMCVIVQVFCKSLKFSQVKQVIMIFLRKFSIIWILMQ